jgi:hypothetical protein
LPCARYRGEIRERLEMWQTGRDRPDRSARPERGLLGGCGSLLVLRGRFFAGVLVPPAFLKAAHRALIASESRFRPSGIVGCARQPSRPPGPHQHRAKNSSTRLPPPGPLGLAAITGGSVWRQRGSEGSSTPTAAETSTDDPFSVDGGAGTAAVAGSSRERPAPHK